MKKANFLNLALLTIALFAAATPKLVLGAQLQYLDAGDNALSRMFHDIRSAKSSIDMTYFLWDPCGTVSKVMMKQVREKTKKGVKVRIGVDAFYQDDATRRKMTTYMKSIGVDFKYFNLNVGQSLRANNRNHAKITLVDNKKYITGGRNIMDEYFGLNKDTNWIDREISVTDPGGSAARAGHEFDTLWNSREMAYESEATAQNELDELKSCLSWGPKEAKLEKFLLEKGPAVLAKTPVDNCADVNFYMDQNTFIDLPRDPAGNDTSDNSYMNESRVGAKPTTRELLKMLKGAGKITMENYSYVPAGKIDDVLREKRKAGVPIRLYTNRFHDSSEPLDEVHDFYLFRDQKAGMDKRSSVKKRTPAPGSSHNQENFYLSKLGSLTQRWELTPKTSNFLIHSKVYVTDSKDTFVSSFNNDPRSYHTNLESGAMVKNCPAFANRVQQSIEALQLFWKKDEIESCLHDDLDKTEPLESLKNWMIFDLL